MREDDQDQPRPREKTSEITGQKSRAENDGIE